MINIKKLSKALKNTGRVRWIIKEDYHFITASYFMLKTKKVITGSALTELVKTLGAIPKEGQGLGVYGRKKEELNDEEIQNTIKMLKAPDNSEEITFTKLIFQAEGSLLSIFKTEKDYIYLNKIYTDLIDIVDLFKNIDIRGTKARPVHFAQGDEKLMIMPFRVRDEAEYVKQI